MGEKYFLQSQERIRELINEFCGGSQQSFADRVGINKASVSQYVNGKNAPGNLTAAKIAQEFGVNPIWVSGFDAPKYDVEKVDAFRDRIFEEHRILFDVLDKADDKQLDQIETIVKTIVGDDDDSLDDWGA